MRSFLSPSRLSILGFALILIANAIALLGVSSNRSGKTEALIELTERELTLPCAPNDENSGLALHLNWRIAQESKDDLDRFWGNWGIPVWLDAQKLSELGFVIDGTCSQEDSKRKEPLPREAFVALEYDGESYQKTLQNAQRVLKKAEAALAGNENDKDLRDRFKGAEENLGAERAWKSRLFAIDAGLDPGKLRERYPDRSKFIITRGIVELTCRPDKIAAAGRISYIRVDKINVPLSYRKFLDSMMAQDNLEKCGQKSPRYKVQLAYGSRFEPWLQRIDELLK